MTEPWVINASPVILLAKVGLIERLPALANPLVIPEPAAREILAARDDAAARWVAGPGQTFVRSAAPELSQFAESGMGPGERAVISWAATHRGFLAVLDDREARLAAMQLGIKILGTVGVVLRLKRAGLIPEARAPLLQIRNAGGYIGEALLREALRSAGEHP